MLLHRLVVAGAVEVTDTEAAAAAALYKVVATVEFNEWWFSGSWAEEFDALLTERVSFDRSFAANTLAEEFAKDATAEAYGVDVAVKDND